MAGNPGLEGAGQTRVDGEARPALQEQDDAAPWDARWQKDQDALGACVPAAKRTCLYGTGAAAVIGGGDDTRRSRPSRTGFCACAQRLHKTQTSAEEKKDD